jgi:hypothetical protein
LRTTLNEWQQTIRRVVTIPGAEVLVALAVVLFATWFLVQDDVALQGASASYPLYSHR